MTAKVTRQLIRNVMIIFIDIFNLAEQLGIYFILKENDFGENVQRRFFFILFSIGAASLLKQSFSHLSVQITFSLCIEGAELISYLLLLPRTTSLLVIAILFFILETIFHAVSILCVLTYKGNFPNQFPLAWCTTPLRLLYYGLLFETQILFLFVDPNSPFRNTFYEILVILSIFFGLITVEKVVLSTFNMDDHTNDDKVYRIWHQLLKILSILEYPILMITGIIYASKMLQDRAALKIYDFIIYILIVISYGLGLLATALVLGCTLHWYMPKSRWCPKKIRFSAKYELK